MTKIKKNCHEESSDLLPHLSLPHTIKSFYFIDSYTFNSYLKTKYLQKLQYPSIPSIAMVQDLFF